MSFASATPHVLGRNQKFYAVAETTPGTINKSVAAYDARTTSFKNEVTRTPWNVPGDNRDAIENITGKGSATWSAESEIIPSGTAVDDNPQHSDLWEAAMGTKTVNAGTSVVYSLNSAQTVKTLTLMRCFNDIYQEVIWGAPVNSMKIAASGADPAMVTFEGWGQGYALGVGDASVTASGDVITFANQKDFNRFMTGSIVSCGATNNVVLVSSTGLTRTTETSGAPATGTIKPYAPTHSTVGSPIAGIFGSLTLHDGSSALDTKITAFEVNVGQNIIPFEEEAFEQYPCDGVPGWREITGTISFKMRKDWLPHMSNVQEYATRAITVTFGDTATRRCVVSIPYAEMNWFDAQISGDREGVCSLPFRALPSSGNDLMTVTFN